MLDKIHLMRGGGRRAFSRAVKKRDRQASSLEIEFVPVPLDAGLAIGGGGKHIQTDRPITCLHVHDCLELGYCFSGSGVFVVGEKVLPFSAGDVSFINHTEVHLARSAPGTESEWTWIYLDPMRLAGQGGAALDRLDPTPCAGADFENILGARAHPAINRVVARMIEELRAPKTGSDDALRALAWELMVLMRRLVPAGKRSKGGAQARRDYDRLGPALQMFSREYADPLRMKELARRCGMSEPHFRRLFKQTLGRPPHTYWNDLRLRMAASLLRGSSRSVLEISHDVGFGTLSSFNRLFRAHFGVAPREWRKEDKSADCAD